MRIGIDCRVYGSLGASIGRYVEWLVGYVGEFDKDNEYILFFNEPQFSEYDPPNKRFKKVLVDAATFSIAEQTTFLYKLIREKLDCMHFMGYRAPVLYFRPFVVTIHGLLPLFYPNKKMASSLYRGLYRSMLRSVTKKAKKIIAVSRHVGRDLSEMANVPEEKIELIFPGIKQEATKRVSSEELKKYLLQQGIQNPYILFVGNILEHKNLSRFIRAYAASIADFPDLDMVIAGKEDSMYHEVREVVIEHGLQKRVHMMGFVEDEKLPLLYQGAIASFSPSLYEGFEFFLLESMAAGVPIICSNVPGLSEVTSETWAVFFRPLSIKNMQEALGSIVSDAGLRDALIQSGNERVRTFSWEKAGKEICRVYTEAVPSKWNRKLSIP